MLPERRQDALTADFEVKTVLGCLAAYRVHAFLFSFFFVTFATSRLPLPPSLSCVCQKSGLTEPDREDTEKFLATVPRGVLGTS